MHRLNFNLNIAPPGGSPPGPPMYHPPGPPVMMPPPMFQPPAPPPQPSNPAIRPGNRIYNIWVRGLPRPESDTEKSKSGGCGSSCSCKEPGDCNKAKKEPPPKAPPPPPKPEKKPAQIGDNPADWELSMRKTTDYPYPERTKAPNGFIVLLCCVLMTVLGVLLLLAMLATYSALGGRAYPPPQNMSGDGLKGEVI